MGMGIHCCKNCVAPKRHPGCHSTCKEYRDERAKLTEANKKQRENRSYVLTSYDFDEIAYADSKRHSKECKYHKRRR